MKPITCIVLIALLFFSCTQTKRSKYSLRDSVLNEYLSSHDSLASWDTTDWSFKILKAYQKNDTAFLKNFQSEMKYRSSTSWRDIAERLKLPSIDKMQADEVYRFDYSASLCPYEAVITITIMNDATNLHAIVLQGLSPDADTSKVKAEYDKKLTQEDINDIEQALKYANFWALKPIEIREGGCCYDGDNLTIDGYIKKSPDFNEQSKRSVVYRWGISRLALNKALKLVLKLADIKEKCLLEN